MWILSKHGFTSTVNYDPSKDRDKKSPFPAIAKQAGTHKLIRARRMEHLEHLKTSGIVPNLVIVDDRGADYRYRSVIKNEQYYAYIEWLAKDIDYWSHFKEAMRAAQPEHLKSSMYSAAMSIWTTMNSVTHVKTAAEKAAEKAKQPTVSQYQHSRGVKPWGSKSKSERAAAKKEEAKGQGTLFQQPGRPPTKQITPAGSPGSMDVEALVELIAKRKGNLHFSGSDLKLMSDAAFEVACELQKRYGSKANVAENLVRKVADEVVDEIIASENEKVI